MPFIRGEILRCLRSARSDSPADKFDPISPDDAAETVRELLWSLPPQDAQLISLRFLSGLTQRETGERLGLSQSAVSRREKRILESLRI